ncbi:MAG: phosphoenolpyruvate synthase [Deltaproteobacteria bacterium]|nr:phosphoenolpyruvate synthase [Deltaproteobacteria bacterium]
MRDIAEDQPPATFPVSVSPAETESHHTSESTEGHLEAPAIVDKKLSRLAFIQISGNLAGYPFVKVVVDKQDNQIHFLKYNHYKFHADYIGEQILKIPLSEVLSNLDEFNHSLYLKKDRRFYLGILALHRSEEGPFFTLETIEHDNMDAAMLLFFFKFVKSYLDKSIPLLYKPASHLHESLIATIDTIKIPRVYNHELFTSSRYIALNTGCARGRLRVFKSNEAYTESLNSIEWFDIIVMSKVPDNIPRVSGIINADFTTPLSHTNILASGWQIPNAVSLGVFAKIETENLDGQWVSYEVKTDEEDVLINKIDKPQEVSTKPVWQVQKINLETPDTLNTRICRLDNLRSIDNFSYGTKAANLGELRHVLNNGSDKLIGFYRIKRPPRENLLPYLANYLKTDVDADLDKKAYEFIKTNLEIPNGIAIPFSVQQAFLQSSPAIQQAIGKLKMALELNARQTDALCIKLQQLIQQTRIPDQIRFQIDACIARHLGGVSSFVVRSSSNAEDLEKFSAAGIYESINHVTTSDKIFESIKKVWASLLSPRSVHLRQEVGISLDDCYMGVIVQEEIQSDMGGVLVTTNPINRKDVFRDVYLNVSNESVTNVVQGSELPYQCLFNTLEGGGKTISMGNSREDLSHDKKEKLQKLAVAGRFLQSHFSPDYTFSTPLDVEWIANGDKIYILQLRPYVK